MMRAVWVEDILCGRVPPWSDVRASGTEVLDACAALELSEVVHDRLTRSRQGNDWPCDVLRELESRAHTAAARELVRAREVTDVLEALAARGVFPILLKGAALAYTIYDSPIMRPRVDTDLFITRDEVVVAREIFQSRGYFEPPLTDGELVFCQFQMEKEDAFGVEHVFDVHWKISSQTLFADLLTFDEMRKDAVAVRPLGPNARTVCGSQALLLACVHPVMHHRNTDRVIWNYDIDLLVRSVSPDDLRQFARLALDKRVAAVCARQLSVAIERFGTPVPSDVVKDLTITSSTEPASVYLRPDRRWHHELVWNIRALQTWRDRFRLLREILFPDVHYMLDAYHLGSSGVVLLPALYAHRCVRGALKILAGNK